jgi:biopolymer transport protein ExbD
VKKLLPERSKAKPQIIVTNLIDVILLLVFFFMITSSFAKDAQRIPVELPAASSSAQSEGESLTFQIDKTGAVFAAGAVIDLAAVTAKTAEYVGIDRTRPILVEADQDTNYGQVLHVLDTVRLAGGINIGLATRPGLEKHPVGR